MREITTTITETRLWRRTLAENKRDKEQIRAAKQRLREEFQRFRDRAGDLVEEIAKDIPGLTIHDITHLDALWEVADTILGEYGGEKDYDINPAEAFVLGGAILLHDAGMSLAAWKDGRSGIKKLPEWPELLTAAFKAAGCDKPSKKQLAAPPLEVEQAVVARILRDRHAKVAEELLEQRWFGKHQYSLLEDQDLHTAFAVMIGEIARSHWQSVAELERIFQGPEVNTPFCGWTIDRLKIACILRCADAAQIDNRRAQGFKRALRRPKGVSDTHWRMQEQLYPPTLTKGANDALNYAIGSKFKIEDAEAWWLAFDTLSMIDRELRDVHALLADTNRRPFAARRVCNIESPERLAQAIGTDGWHPIDAHVHVGDLPRLVHTLGGEALYGNDRSVVIRELMQNGADAIRAHRKLKSLPDDWGQITVRTGKEGESEWLEVEDNGIGLSTQVVRNFLLNFTASYWGSSAMREEFPTLAQDFAPTGKFGIGFFCVFMIGDHIRITSKRVNTDKQIVVEFLAGVATRPIVRAPRPDEERSATGTCVRVYLRKDVPLASILVDEEQGHHFASLRHLCSYLAPALDVTVKTKRGKEVEQVAVTANDWRDMDAAALLYRTASGSLTAENKESVAELAPFLQPIYDSKKNLLGRLCASPDFFRCVDYRPEENCRVGFRGNVGGFGADTHMVNQIAGILQALPETAARTRCSFNAKDLLLTDWACKQSDLFKRYFDRNPGLESQDRDLATHFRNSGIDIKRHIVGKLNRVHITGDNLLEALRTKETISIIDLYEFDQLEHLNVAQDLIVTNYSSTSRFFNMRCIPPWVGGNKKLWVARTLGGAVLEIIAEAWGMDVLSLAKRLGSRETTTIETDKGPITVRGITITRP